MASSTTTTTPPPISYQVKRGDTLTSLARFFGVSTAVLAVSTISPTETSSLKLTGAQAGETVTFEIDAPRGDKFTGPPHTAAPDGSVSATYQTNPIDAPGTYTAVATGDHGTSVRATFRVDPNSPST